MYMVKGHTLYGKGSYIIYNGALYIKNWAFCSSAQKQLNINL